MIDLSWGEVLKICIILTWYMLLKYALKEDEDD